MNGAYYNEIDPYCVEWLRNLIFVGLIADGVVDDRSISDVCPDDLRGFKQCHFFAGIGGWSHALRLAGWSDDRPVWTGSCPCQPFSVAGRAGGFADERHLWPHWFHLVGERRPTVVFGEQVASKDAASWLDLVQDDLEGLDYAFGAIPFPAASVGAPHIRDRTYWMAHAHERGRGQEGRAVGELGSAPTGGMADAQRRNPTKHTGTRARSRDADSTRASSESQGCGEISDTRSTSSVNGFWRTADWLFCRDGKWRPVEPGTFPLAHGVSNRVGRLRAYGNAIVPQEAAAFIAAAMECAP